MKRHIGELLAAALERRPGERDAFLDAACGNDIGLRCEIASLLAAHERTGPMDRLGAHLKPLTTRLGKPTPSLTGRTFDSHEVGERIGGGGMGVVYQGLDTRSGRAVALKFLRPGLQADVSAAQRFRLETQIVSVLEHPNICAVLEIGETERGQLFLVMPLYEGETLKQRIARGPLPPGEAVAVAAQIARALDNVHQQRIVHRDIKPSNVFVCGDGTVKLLDFGVAKLAGVTLTGAAGPLGTVAYMSPEQAAGEVVDERTDLWSLGVVLYEMLAGRVPFPGVGSAAVNAMRRGELQPLSEVRSGVPPALERVVAKALARAPGARYRSAEAFGRDLLNQLT